jgi:negative regulator of sigma E activity
MNDDDLPTNDELASAYLDGELDPVERAAAAADPDVMHIVDSFAAVRAALGETGPVLDSTRTAALDAALAEFDARHSDEQRGKVAAASAPGATITSLQSRRMRTYRAVAGVAAAIVILAIGIATIKNTGSDSKTSSAVELDSTATNVPAAADALPSTKVAAADAQGPSDTSAGASAGNVSIESATSPSDSLPSIETDDQLKRFVSRLAPSPDQPPAPAATSAPTGADRQTAVAGAYATPPCLASDQVVLATILFQGHPAFAVLDSATNHLQAIDAGSCRVLTDVTP